jgi:hypothetical protein
VEEVIFQELDKDYLDDADPQLMLSAIQKGLAAGSGYCCTIYLGGVASASPQLYVGQFAPDYALVCVKLKGESTDLRALRSIAYYATGERDSEAIFHFRAEQTRLRAPARLLVSDSSALLAATAFIRGEGLAPELKWVDLLTANCEVYESC